MSSITLNQIKYVLALDKTRSFSNAAEMCFVTQSTLSTMIRKLENQLDLELFDRKSKPIKLTQEGIGLMNHFKILYHEYEHLLELVQETKDKFYGTLKIGIIPTLAPFLLPLFLDQLVANHPEVNFSINEITTHEITSRLKLRELDIGILSLPVNDKELKQTTLFNEDFLVYDTRIDSTRKRKYKINDIDINRLWLLEESHCLTSQIQKICHLRKINNARSNLIFNSGSILSLLELVHMNNGLTLLPRLATKQANLINQNFVHTLESPVPVREIGIATHSNFTKKRLLNILGRVIKKSVKPILSNSKKIRIIPPF